MTSCSRKKTITVEMIKRGGDIILQYDREYENCWETAIEVYRVMEAARLNPNEVSVNECLKRLYPKPISALP
jgi:hypothetical protein